MFAAGFLCSGGLEPGAAAFVEKRADGLGAHQFFQFFEVFPKDRFALDGILQALQIGIQGLRAIRWQRIDHPALVALAGRQAALPQIGQMLGNHDLRFAQDRLDMADAQRRYGEKIENPKPGLIAEALVNRDQLHERSISIARYK